MRFRFGRIPDNPDFFPEKDGWTPLREPKVWLFQVAAGAAGLVAAIVVFYLWKALTAVVTVPEHAVSDSLVILSIVGVVAAHEAFHMAAHPGAGTRPASVLGVWPAGLVVYAHYDGPMSRNRFVLMILLPFLALSLGSLAICAATGLDSLFVAGCSVLNALFAGGDLVTAGLVLAQVPARAEVRNQGWWTWWRASDAEPVYSTKG